VPRIAVPDLAMQEIDYSASLEKVR